MLLLKCGMKWINTCEIFPLIWVNIAHEHTQTLNVWASGLLLLRLGASRLFQPWGSSLYGSCPARSFTYRTPSLERIDLQKKWTYLAQFTGVSHYAVFSDLASLCSRSTSSSTLRSQILVLRNTSKENAWKYADVLSISTMSRMQTCAYRNRHCSASIRVHSP